MFKDSLLQGTGEALWDIIISTGYLHGATNPAGYPRTRYLAVPGNQGMVGVMVQRPSSTRRTEASYPSHVRGKNTSSNCPTLVHGPQIIVAYNLWLSPIASRLY